MNLEFRFEYEFNPTVVVRAVNPSNGRTAAFEACIDTGADGTLLDSAIARDIGLVITGTMFVGGVRSTGFQAGSASIKLYLLGRPELEAVVDAAFAPGIASTVGNLIGLDALEIFDFALSQRSRFCYLGRASG